MSRISVCILSCLVLAPLSAQIKVETFDGPGLPAGWTVQSGTWSIKNGRAVQSVNTTAYMTLNGVKLKNCVVEADVYWGGLGIQLGGVAARHAGTSTEDCVMVKVQSNGSTVAGFDTLWNYERPGGRVSKVGIAPLMTKTRIRLLCVGNQGWLEIDSTQDGILDTVVGPMTYAAHTAPGLVGIVGYNRTSTSAIDNFALYDAVLMAGLTAAGGPSTPKIGTTYNMKLTTQATTITPFVTVLSLSNGGTVGGNLGGIPIGAGMRIPLGLDIVFDTTLAIGGGLGLNGVTNATGVGNPKLVIPPLAGLIGFGVHAASVTFGNPSNPMGIDNISNNHYIKFVP